MTLRLRTNAKINLYLGVREKLSDGFHSIETVFHSVSLADRLIVEGQEEPFRVEMASGSGSMDLPPPGANIVHAAARALATWAGREPTGRVDILKHIPVAAGLAGGSANAAGALLALQRLWGTDADLASLGAGLGADVPFCLSGGTMLATGKGEILSPLEAPTLWFVLGIDDRPLSTADVYGEWRAEDQGEFPVERMVEALDSADSAAIAAAFRNDLEFPAFRLRPDLLDKKASLLEAGALGASLSGSGPTLFGLATDEAHSRQVAEACKGNFHRVEVVSSTPVCVEEEGADS